jgi:hypothetical protein
MQLAMRACGCLTLCLAVGAAGLSCGCGEKAANMADVSGTVTMDGQPLSKARIEFSPTANGSPSMGLTDERGRYSLRFSRDMEGAMIGDYQVKISTYAPANPDAEPPTVEVPEKVPAKYNIKTELTGKVVEGSNTIDFPLQSGGEIISPETLAVERR